MVETYSLLVADWPSLSACIGKSGTIVAFFVFFSPRVGFFREVQDLVGLKGTIAGSLSRVQGIIDAYAVTGSISWCHLHDKGTDFGPRHLLTTIV